MICLSLRRLNIIPAIYRLPFSSVYIPHLSFAKPKFGIDFNAFSSFLSRSVIDIMIAAGEGEGVRATCRVQENHAYSVLYSIQK